MSKTRLDLSWRPERRAKINDEILEYDIGVFPNQVILVEKWLKGFVLLGTGVCYSIDGMLMKDTEQHVYFRRPEGMTNRECDPMVDRFFDMLNDIERVTKKPITLP